MKDVIEGQFLTPEGQVKSGTVMIEDGLIVRCDYRETVSAAQYRGIIMPGFIDVHVHGGGGSDVMDATEEALDCISRTHGAMGTTSWLATTVTQSPELTERAIDAFVAYTKSGYNGSRGALALGLHLEGPFLNPKLKGAHLAECLAKPDRQQFSRWCDRAEGWIKMITLAPELEGAQGVIEEAVNRGIVVSAGHTDATSAEIGQAAEWGVSHVTHLFNAMRPLHHREPGLIGHVLSNPAFTADLIVDGIHLHPEIIELALRVKGADKLLLITDAMRAACLGDGEYESGGLKVKVTNGEARVEDGTLAGSLLTLNKAFLRMVGHHGLSLAEASRMSSFNAAALLGMTADRGAIAEGKRADLVYLEADGSVGWTMVNGRIVYRTEGIGKPEAAK